jgi:predicted ATP-grasp superfamily ATP-dependent carboligase
MNSASPGALVLDGDTRTALAIVRSLARRGVLVTVAASAPRSLAGSSRYAHRRLELPDPMTAPERLANALVDLAGREPGAVWFPVTDQSLAVVDAVREHLAGILLPIPERDALALAWDKSRLPELAESAGFAVPRTWQPGSAADAAALAPQLDYPVVLKPRRSRHLGPQGFVPGEVAYVRSAAALAPAWEALAARIPGPIIQERVPGAGMGLFVLADRGRVLTRFAHRRLREKPPSGGVSVLSESIAVPPALAESADRLMAELHWHGVCMIEFKLAGSEVHPWLIEINPRFWGSLALAIAAGVDFPWLVYRLALGDSVPTPATYRVGMRSRWELGDLDHLLIRWRGRDPGADAAAPSRLRSLLAFLSPWAGRPEVFRPDDPAPGLVELGRYLMAWRRRPDAGGGRTRDARQDLPAAADVSWEA